MPVEARPKHSARLTTLKPEPVLVRSSTQADMGASGLPLSSLSLATAILGTFWMFPLWTFLLTLSLLCFWLTCLLQVLQAAAVLNNCSWLFLTDPLGKLSTGQAQDQVKPWGALCF